MTLDLIPGTDLDEATLMTHYGISRTPLREVLQPLAGAGLIEISDNRGAKAASMDLEVLRTFFSDRTNGVREYLAAGGGELVRHATG